MWCGAYPHGRCRDRTGVVSVEPVMYFWHRFPGSGVAPDCCSSRYSSQRAVRLTMRRLEATPLSISGSAPTRSVYAGCCRPRRLEMSVAQMKTKTTSASLPSSAKKPTPSISSRRSSARRPRPSSPRPRDKTQREQLRTPKFQIKTARCTRSAPARRQGRAGQAGRRTRRAFDHVGQPARRACRLAHPSRSDEGQRRRLRTHGEGRRAAP